MTHQNFSLFFQIFSDWEAVESIRSKVKNELEQRGWHKNFVADVSMCAAELSGNIVKYGNAPVGFKGTGMVVNIDSDRVIVQTTNAIKREEDLDNVKRLIERIHTSGMPERLHVKRLIEILKEPKHDATQLGFYRIAYEGAFEIDYVYEHDILTITATRQIQNGDFMTSGGDHA